MSRERVYAEFLKQHAPSKCNVVFGGFLFGEDGLESGHLDVLVTTDTAPRFNFQNKDGLGKTFSPVEGTLGIASIKSTLSKNELVDALTGIARIPPTSSLEGRVSLTLSIPNYEDWPYKIIYASDGIAATTLMQHLNDFYNEHESIPLSRRPNVIHVSGKYVIFRVTTGMNIWDSNLQMQVPLEEGSFRIFTDDLEEAYVSQHIALTRLVDTRLAKWVHQTLTTDTGPRAQLLGFSRGDKPGLNLPNIRDVLIPLPSFTEQAAIVERVEELMQYCRDLECEILSTKNYAEKLMQAVLKEAFSN